MEKKVKKELLLYAILIIIFSIAIAPKSFQNDTFFTIAIGNNILNNGIDNTEVLVWHENLEFTNVRWLFNVLIALIYNIFDFFGIYLFVILMSCLIGITLFKILLKNKLNNKLCFFMTILIMYLGQGILAARAQIVSIWLFLVEIYYIEKVLSDNKKIDKFILFLIPILVANFHTSLFIICFVFYIPYFAEYALANALKTNDNSKLIIEKRVNIKSLFIIFVFSVFTGFCTPLGSAAYTVMIEASKGFSSVIIEELQPLVLADNIGFMMFIVIIIAILTFSKTKIKITDCFLLLGLGLMSLSTIRAIFYFIFIGGISLSRSINQFFKDYGIFEYEISKKANILINIVLVIFVIPISFSTIVNKSLKEYAPVDQYPVEACKYIKENIDIKNMRIYNGFNIGSYLEFKEIPAFMDSRSEIYCPEFNDTNILQEFAGITSGTIHYNEIFDKYEITHVLVEHSELINTFISKDIKWKSIYQDDTFIIYERN